MALSQYVIDTREYLHDRNGTIYQLDDLVNYINRGRRQITAITQCVRSLQIVNLVNQQETYPLPNINANGYGQVLNVFNISVPWGTFKPTLNRWVWSQFQAYFRSYSTIAGFPSDWALYNKQAVYFFPIPQQSFASEWDCSADVMPLTSDQSIEQIPYPFTEAVSSYAAMLALIGAQRYQESQAMKEIYHDHLKLARASVTPSFVSSPY